MQQGMVIHDVISTCFIDLISFCFFKKLTAKFCIHIYHPPYDGSERETLHLTGKLMWICTFSQNVYFGLMSW